jgi:hypothetical protein
MKYLTGIFGLIAAGVFLSCTVPENQVVRDPVERIQMVKNQTELPDRYQFDMQEGESVILGARLFPLGVTGGVHWQSSSRGIVEMSNFAGPEITITGTNGGRTIVSAMARNIHNEVYVQSECTVSVIPRSFFKWDYTTDGWIDLPALSNGIVGRIDDTLVRSGETPVMEDPQRRGIVLEGPGTLMIGSVLNSPTNSPFDFDPVYDQGGAFNFLDGPSLIYDERVPNESNTTYTLIQTNKPYSLWNNKVRITIDYEITGTGLVPLRIQVNNNTLERNNASAIGNWNVAELPDNASGSGTLTGIFNASAAELSARATGIVSLDDVLKNSFVCLSLPEGKLIIRSIHIEAGE